MDSLRSTALRYTKYICHLWRSCPHIYPIQQRSHSQMRLAGDCDKLVRASPIWRGQPLLSVGCLLPRAGIFIYSTNSNIVLTRC